MNKLESELFKLGLFLCSFLLTEWYRFQLPKIYQKKKITIEVMKAQQMGYMLIEMLAMNI